MKEYTKENVHGLRIKNRPGNICRVEVKGNEPKGYITLVGENLSYNNRYELEYLNKCLENGEFVLLQPAEPTYEIY